MFRMLRESCFVPRGVRAIANFAIMRWQRLDGLYLAYRRNTIFLLWFFWREALWIRVL